ncbi:SPOR domain-containing protein [Acuticoccus mangrovi]|uniref:SPOR domain-containing protein n=1 Tax=Acuticoccus mangrovi TaxID=2796142 RepID=A0A934MH29_9HYPH|nr:SPOR domain-containing protein [Acuticoccus mangrovi]
MFDELDQFVDSEPVGWASGPRRPSRAPIARDDDTAPGAEREPRDAEPEPQAEERADAAFSQQAATGRRDAFAKRLSDELSRPPEAKPQSKPQPQPQSQSRPQSGPERGDEEPPRRQRVEQPSREGASERSVARAADDASVRRETARPVADTAERPEIAASANPEEAALPSTPADALEWELDNAIGAIIANGRAPQEEPPPLPPPVPVAQEPEPVRAAPPPPPPPAPVRKADKVEKVERAPTPPVGTAPLSGKRVKPIPTFRFERREEPAEPFPVAPPDADDPLASVFFPDARDAFKKAHPYDDDEGHLSELEQIEVVDPDDLDDYETGYDEYEELPPSLSRAARPVRRGRLSLRSPLMLSLIGGGVVVVLAALVGLLGLSSSDSPTGAPPVIHADARNVKVRPEDTGSDARPDITERAALGETDRLVMPERVRLEPTIATPPPDEDEGLVSRQVRTVVVRPDGTIVPASTVNDRAADSVARRSETPSEPEPQDVPSEPAVASGGAVSPLDQTPPAQTTDNDADAEAAPAYDPAGEADDVLVPRPRPAPPRPTHTASASTPTSTSGPVDLTPSTARTSQPETRAQPQRQTQAETSVVRPSEVTAYAAPASPAASAPWAVQVSSQRSRADAERSFRNLQRRYPAILGNVEPLIVPATVGDRGQFYRVRIAAQSRSEAASLCQRLKSAGADCFIGRN